MFEVNEAWVADRTAERTVAPRQIAQRLFGRNGTLKPGGLPMQCFSRVSNGKNASIDAVRPVARLHLSISSRNGQQAAFTARNRRSPILPGVQIACATRCSAILRWESCVSVIRQYGWQSRSRPRRFGAHPGAQRRFQRRNVFVKRKTLVAHVVAEPSEHYNQFELRQAGSFRVRETGCAPSSTISSPRLVPSRRLLSAKRPFVGKGRRSSALMGGHGCRACPGGLGLRIKPAGKSRRSPVFGLEQRCLTSRAHPSRRLEGFRLFECDACATIRQCASWFARRD